MLQLCFGLIRFVIKEPFSLKDLMITKSFQRTLPNPHCRLESSFLLRSHYKAKHHCSLFQSYRLDQPPDSWLNRQSNTYQTQHHVPFQIR